MNEYAVFLHDDPAVFRDLSPSEMQAIIQRYSAWGEKLRAANRHVTSKKLADDGGRHVRRQQGKITASDGPYAETKDIIGGLFVIRADNYDEAVAALADCPHLEFGWIELREIDMP